MDNEEALEIMKAEQECARHRIDRSCDLNCNYCYLRDNEQYIISAYGHVIYLLKKQEPKQILDKSCFAGVTVGNCPQCGAGLNIEDKFCYNCGTEIEWRELPKYNGGESD